MSEILSNSGEPQNITTVNSKVQPTKLGAGSIGSCCQAMVDKLSHINPMMVCGDCKQIIKTFRDERAYRNYVKFCDSRSRIYTTGYYAEQWLVIFHAYDA